jgi:hypothetical protein
MISVDKDLFINNFILRLGSLDITSTLLVLGTELSLTTYTLSLYISINKKEFLVFQRKSYLVSYKFLCIFKTICILSCVLFF